MALKGIIELSKDILEEFLENNNITDYEVVIGKQDIKEINKYYIGIIPENIQYKKINNITIIPNYAVNLLIAIKTNFETFIYTQSELIENLITYLYERMLITNISIADLEYDDINNTTIITIRYEITI